PGLPRRTEERERRGPDAGAGPPPTLPYLHRLQRVAEKLAILSQKGGTGKTTTVRTLADAFRRAGLSVLTADLDPQGNLSDYFDVPADAAPTMGDVLSGRVT